MIRKEVVVAKFKVLNGNWGLRTNTKNLSPDSQSPGRDSNPGPPEYEGVTATTFDPTPHKFPQDQSWNFPPFSSVHNLTHSSHRIQLWMKLSRRISLFIWRIGGNWLSMLSSFDQHFIEDLPYQATSKYLNPELAFYIITDAQCR
jgi:hypothetical protein